MTETPYEITIIITLSCLVVAELFRIVRRRDVVLFFGVIFAIVDPLVYTFVFGRPFHESIVNVAIGAFYLWRWWKHRNDDDDDERGQRIARWVKSKLPKPDARPVRVPAA